MVPTTCAEPELLAMPMVFALVPERRTLLPLRVKALPPEKVMPSNAVPAVKSLLSVVGPLEPKRSESPAWGGALPPVQLPGALQLAPALPVQVSLAAEAS